MSKTIKLSPIIFYEEAEKMLEGKDLLGFMSKISIAEVLAGDDVEMLAKVTFLHAKGLYEFHQHNRALKYIHHALEYNSGGNAVRLKNYRGVIFGYLGEIEKAENIFRESINEVQDDVELLIIVLLNNWWINWVKYKSEKKDDSLQMMKKYLELANAHFNEVDDKLKGKILNNYSVYYFNLGDIDKAIEIGEKALQYFEERDLPKMLNNLAVIYISFEEDGISEKALEYLNRAEVIGQKYTNNLEVAKTFYNKAEIELREDQLFTALDTLYLAFEHFKQAEALTYAIDVLGKIMEVTNEHNLECFKSLEKTLKKDFEGTSLYKKI